MEHIVNTLAVAGLLVLVLTPGLCYPPITHYNQTNTECCLTVPKSVDECFASSLTQPISSNSARVDCLQRLLWDYKHKQNLTDQDRMYFSLLSKDRSLNGEPQPKTGFRIRKEYRRYTDAERTRLHKAFQNLYKKDVLRKYAELHKLAVNTVHNSVAYLSWHRVFLAIFEDELRLEDSTVSLPYLDTTLDNSMDNPVNSIIWSSKFLGNANGDVLSGPFGGWKSARGKLWREYGSHPRGKLISEESINKILTKCRTDDIVFPIQSPNGEEANSYIIEYHSNGVHNWVGGDMSDLHFAAYDPVFYMLQAFVDLIWEQFRLHQKTVCGIDPETDYPSKHSKPGIMPNDFMVGFDTLTYQEGVKNYWTKNWYNYENIPRCPDCGSKYLFCNSIKGKCASHSRRTDYNAGLYYKPPLSEPLGLPAEPFEPVVELIPKHTFGKFLPAPLRDRRTRESAKLDAKTAERLKASPALTSHRPTDPSQNNSFNTFFTVPVKDQNTLTSANHYVKNAAVPNGAGTNSIIKGTSSNPNNFETLLNMYINMLAHNYQALGNQGASTAGNNQTSKGTQPTKAILNDTLKKIDILSRLQTHKNNINRKLPANLTKGSNTTIPQLQSLDLTNIMNQNLSPPSKPVVRRRKYLKFV